MVRKIHITLENQNFIFKTISKCLHIKNQHLIDDLRYQVEDIRRNNDTLKEQIVIIIFCSNF